MNKKKLGKVTGVATASFLIAGTTAFTAFAAMPSGTAVIGDKAYDLNYVNDPANQEEITAAMVAADFKVYVKDFAGNWIVNETEAALTDLSVIPAVEYKAADGTATKYDAKDGDVTSAETALKVDSVSALTAKSLKVTFNTAVTDTSKVSFTVKNGSINVALTATWADDKKSVELSRTSNLATGDYTVTAAVDGYTFADGANVGKVTVVAQKVAKIEFVSPQLVKNAAGTAGTFRYKVYDQYGTDVTASMASSNFTVSGVVGTTSVSPSLTPSTGVGTVTHTFATTDTKAVITIVNNATGVSATATMDVAASATVASMEFGTPVLPTGKVNIETGVAEAAKIPVTVTDQYGNAITDLATLNSALTLISSSTGVTPTFVVINNVPYIALNTSGLSLKTTVVITAVNSANGKTFSNTYTVEKPAVAYSIELGDFSKEVLAVGDTNVVLNAVIKDQFGNELTPAQVADNKSIIDAWFGNTTYLGDIVVQDDRNSVNYGKVVIKLVGDTNNDTVINGSDTAVASTGSSEVIAVTPTDLKVQTKTITVSPARVVNEVANINAISLVQGATTNVKLGLFDQYQQALTNTSVAAGATYNTTALTTKTILTKVSGDDGAVTATVNGAAVTSTGTIEANEQYIASIPVTAAADKTGVYTLTVQLLNASSEVVSQASVTLNVVKNNVSGITYSVADIPTLAGDANYSATVANGHAVPVTISAVDANGNTFVVNPSDIVSVTSNNATAVITGQIGSTWYVAGQNVAALTADQRKATITITINTLDGFKTITKDVTVSPAAPVIQQVRVVSAALANGFSRDLAVTDSTLVDKLTYDFATKDLAQLGTAIHVIGLDQYGCWSDITSVALYVNNKNYAAVDAFKVLAGNLVLDSAKRATVTSGQDLLVTLTKDGASKQITVKIAGSDVLTATQHAPAADATFTASANYAGFALNAAAMTDMDTTTTAVDSSVVINGLTYTVSGTTTGTVTVTGTATATAAAATQAIKVLDSATGAYDTLTINISAVTAGGTSTVTITE